MKRVVTKLLVILVLVIPICTNTYQAHKREQEEQNIDFEQYYVEDDFDIEAAVYGEDSGTDFVPGYYEAKEDEFNPYPGSIVKHIEATAYCYGELTCTGKKIREGYAAMSKRYLGMTAVVYEADENGQPLDYIGTYEIEDTGGDYRIKNGNCIDIYIPDYEAAVEFGRKLVVVYLIEAKG